jgi:hypothetical protein
VSFSTLTRFARQHAYRLVMPPALAFSVSLGTAVLPDGASIPGVDQATMAISMTPWAASKSASQPSEVATITTPVVPTVATAEPTATSGDESTTVATTPEPAPVAEAAPVEAPVVAMAPAAPVAEPKALAWGAVVSPTFVARVHQMCADLGCESNDLMAAMAFESVETFSPSVRNPMSGATGLIQFMSDTARGLGTSTEELAAMSAESQLEYVDRYMRPYQGRLSSISDIYMAILWPRAVGQAEDYPLFPSGTIQYTQNAHLDVDGDGVVTKQEAAGLVTSKLRKGQRPEYVLVESPTIGVASNRS